MSVLALAAAIALPAAAATLWLRRGAGAAPREPVAAAGLLAAAVVLGQGAAALLAFGWLLAGGALDTRYAAADAALFAAAALALAWRSPGGAPAPPAPAGRAAWPAAALLGLGLVAAGVALAVAYGASPHGEWDAWAIWNQRARFLHRAGVDWRAALEPGAALGQPDYPLALPLMVARLHAFAGESLLSPQLVAALFTLAAPPILAGAVARRAGPLAGAAAGLLLLATSAWLDLGAMQYADVPVATLLLLGAAAAGEALERPAPRVEALAGGLALGVAGFTKDEGLAGAACLWLAWGAAAWRGRGARAALGELAVVAAGAAPAAAAWFAFRGLLGSGLAPGFLGGSGAARALDPSRWALILERLPANLPGALLWLPVAAPALALGLGLRPGRLARGPALPAGLALLAAILLAFAVSPFDLGWHLSTAMARVLLLPWPLLLLGLFGATAPAGR